MNMLGWVIAVTSISGIGGTGLGGVAALFMKRDSSRTVSLLLSFAGGIMIGVTCFDMIPGAISPGGVDRQVNIFFVAFGVLLGYLVVWLLNLWIDSAANPGVDHIDGAHPKTADDLDELIHSDYYVRSMQRSQSDILVGSRLFVAGLVMACAIALHNVPEGMVIGAAYAGSLDTNPLAGSGIIMAIIIGLHDIPEGMAVAVPLISGGAGRLRSLFITAVSGVPTVLGAILGYCLGTLSPMWLSLSLSFASGAMLYVVFGELLPEAILMWRSKLPAFAAVLGVLVGLLLIYL